MVDLTETIDVDIEPVDQSSDSDDGRAFKPKRDQPKEPDPKFEKDDEVWLIHESESTKQAHVMKVCTVKKLQEMFQGKKYVSYEYQLQDAKGLLYDCGRWVGEKNLEFCSRN